MKLQTADIFIVIGLLFFIGAHLTTNYLMYSHKTAAETVQVAESVVEVLESNPIARWAFRTEAIRLIYGFIVVPSLSIGLYYIVRRRGDDVATMAFAITFLLLGTINFLNDFSILLGYLTTI